MRPACRMIGRARLFSDLCRPHEVNVTMPSLPLLAERGGVVSYETVRRWGKKFGASFAERLRRRRPRPGDKWHID